MNKAFLTNNTFHYKQFSDLHELVKKKKDKNFSISLIIPTLNEEKTIAKEIIIMKSELMTRYPLLDEIVVMDSGSSDKTREIARTYGAAVFKSKDILPHLKNFPGKGENLWKALYVTKGDILVYIDADIKNIHHRFAYGLVGPLLSYNSIKFCKAFYDRPISIGKNKIRPAGGGRITELVTRPLFSLFLPELTQLIQPLSGEYAGYRQIFENISFPIGNAVEIGMIIDIYKRWGLDIMAQVDLDRRIHRNTNTKILGRRAFAILKTFIKRYSELGLIELSEQLSNNMIQYNLIKDEYEPDIFPIEDYERPPMIEIPEYKKKFSIDDKKNVDLL